MITEAIEGRFHFAKEIITEYAVSLPIILPDKERVFTYEWVGQEGNKVILIHDLYSLNLSNNTVNKSPIEEKGLRSNRIADGVKGLAAIEIEEKYMALYEKIRKDFYKSTLSEKNQLKEYFNQLITDEALIEMYKRFGKEMFW